VQRRKSLRHVREQEAALLHGLFVVAVEELTQHGDLLGLRHVAGINIGLTLRGALNRTLLASPVEGALHQHIRAVSNPGDHARFASLRQLKGIQRAVYGGGKPRRAVH